MAGTRMLNRKPPLEPTRVARIPGRRALYTLLRASTNNLAVEGLC